jgi:hypothetical protein
MPTIDRNIKWISYGVLYLPFLVFIGALIVAGTSFRCLLYSQYLAPALPAVSILTIGLGILLWLKKNIGYKLKVFSISLVIFYFSLCVILYSTCS